MGITVDSLDIQLQMQSQRAVRNVQKFFMRRTQLPRILVLVIKPRKQTRGIPAHLPHRAPGHARATARPAARPPTRLRAIIYSGPSCHAGRAAQIIAEVKIRRHRRALRRQRAAAAPFAACQCRWWAAVRRAVARARAALLWIYSNRLSFWRRRSSARSLARSARAWSMSSGRSAAETSTTV